jgi:hypothetical protein
LCLETTTPVLPPECFSPPDLSSPSCSGASQRQRRSICRRCARALLRGTGRRGWLQRRVVKGQLRVGFAKGGSRMLGVTGACVTRARLTRAQVVVARLAREAAAKRRGVGMIISVSCAIRGAVLSARLCGGTAMWLRVWLQRWRLMSQFFLILTEQSRQPSVELTRWLEVTALTPACWA